MIIGIDHIGLATHEPARVGEFLAALEMSRSDAGAAEAYGVVCEFWGHTMGGPSIEIVSPARPGSAVAERLEHHGPGIYHVAFQVDDLEEESNRLRDSGFIAIDREPCQGARPGMKVVFLYLGDPANLVIELVQYGRGPA